MQKNLQIWQAIVGLVFAVVSTIAIGYNYAVSIGRNQERIEMTQYQHGERIIKLEEGAKIDRAAIDKQYSLLNDRTYEILILIQNKQDRNK